MDNKSLKIYFCGSIRGGRGDQELYEEIIGFLQEFGTVLTEHVGEKVLQSDLYLSDKEIYIRDIEWLDSADIVVAEVSTPSLGVGFEIARALSLNKKIICLCQENKNDSLSAMIKGCPDLQTTIYSGISEAKEAISTFLNN